MNAFRLEIVTPEAMVFSEEIESLVIPAHEGYLGVLAGHAPLLCTLIPGEIAYTKNGKRIHLTTSGGYMEVTKTKTIILADAVEDPAKIDIGRATKSSERAKERLGHRTKETDVERATAALARALNRIKIAQKYRNTNS